ncbi:hypothetical protein [Halobacteriovorax sp.]|uniref:hypothetical protein n=1 Tax=Halobacteriovorax sp. TaxID=2020862 RepID=UPI0035630EFE
MNNVSETIAEKSSVELLKDQVVVDLQSKLREYSNEKVGMRLLAQKMEISERTFSRLLNKENRPTYQTLLKIYRVIFSSTNDAYVLEVAPDIVKSEINKHNPRILSKEIKYSADIEAEIIHDRAFCEIYFMAASYPLTRDLVQYRYGMHGIETLERMCEMRALKINSDGTYILGPNETTLSAQTLKRVGINLTEKFSKPKNTETGGENLIAFFADGINEKTYDKWLQIDERAFREKVRVANLESSRGEIRAFTFMTTDTMSEN